MMRDEVQMVIKEYEGRALAAQYIIDMPETSEADRARFTGRRDAFRQAATTLAEALEKSEAAPLCGECGTLLSEHPAQCVFAGTPEHRASGEVTP